MLRSSATRGAQELPSMDVIGKADPYMRRGTGGPRRKLMRATQQRIVQSMPLPVEPRRGVWRNHLGAALCTAAGARQLSGEARAISSSVS